MNAAPPNLPRESERLEDRTLSDPRRRFHAPGIAHDDRRDAVAGARSPDWRLVARSAEVTATMGPA